MSTSCPLFGQCGGCQTMDLPYPVQLEKKREKVIAELKRIPSKIEVLPCIGSPLPFHYRNKLQFPVREKGKGMAFGLYAPFSNDLIEIEQCPVHSRWGEEIYQKVTFLLKRSSLRAYDPLSKQGELRHLLIRSSSRLKQALVVLVTNQAPSPLLFELAQEILASHPGIQGVVHNLQKETTNVVLGPTYQLLAGVDAIEEQIHGLRFKISAGSFFQINPEQAEQLFTKALEWAALQGNELVLDAYCGVGTFSLIFARKAKTVLGIECVPQAIENAKINQQLNQIENVQFLCTSVEEYIPSLSSIDVLILNPPRKGCDLSFLKKVVEKMVPKIIYVSCNPKSLARDLHFLSEEGYSIHSVQPFDMFPQTEHVETVVLLER